MTMKAIIRERGNGLTSVGDYVSGEDGEVYTVAKLTGPIHTDAPGCGNYVHAEVELADWDDVGDDSEPVCSCELDDEVAS